LYQSNRNSQLRSVMQEMIQLEFRSRSRTKYLALTPSEKLNTLERKCWEFKEKQAVGSEFKSSEPFRKNDICMKVTVHWVETVVIIKNDICNVTEQGQGQKECCEAYWKCWSDDGDVVRSKFFNVFSCDVAPKQPRISFAEAVSTFPKKLAFATEQLYEQPLFIVMNWQNVCTIKY